MTKTATAAAASNKSFSAILQLYQILFSHHRRRDSPIRQFRIQARYNAGMQAQESENESPRITADFGFAEVDAGAKAEMVGGVFSRVAPYYDRMNDLMSAGMHRVWKSVAVARGDLRPGLRVLDLACGGGDIAARALPRISPGGEIAMADINAKMLAHARRRMRNSAARFVQCNGESLPFAEYSFDRVFIAFGLRNITNRERALAEMRRVLRPGGMCIVLEFSPPDGMFANLRRRYLTSVLPKMGKFCFGDEESYRYLAESVLRFPHSDSLLRMMQTAGFARAEYDDVAAGVVFAHRAWRLS